MHANFGELSSGMRKLYLAVAVLAVILVVVMTQRSTGQSYVGSAPAHEFPTGLDWINTDKPLPLSSLSGKIVLLDFWTYGCINCIHVIPDLKALEEKYPNELVVIGVHSAKFLNEARTENIRLVAERYGRTEPIVNDAEFKIWQDYNISAWPSFVLIDPEGHILGRHAGEGVYRVFDDVIAGMIDTFAARGTLDRTPLTLNATGVVTPRTALSFPGKVLADEAGARLFVADSSNDRIVITDLAGVVLDVVGSGAQELKDGDFESAGFNGPQGMALAGPDTLYVADTGNHSIRLVDLAKRTVTTVAGNGKQEYLFGRNGVEAGGGLNSPWDVLWLDDQLIIAMAGQHQLWSFEPSSGSVRLLAGSGREELKDGALLSAGLNQPSGLTTDGSVLFVADSEASAVRRVDQGPNGRVETLVGTGLFDFGDVDGVGKAVRLQHPLGLAYVDGAVYVADTYNNKIKRLDPTTHEVTTVFGTGTPGLRDGDSAEFYEPGGLSYAAGKLYVADTNNGAIRVADLASRQVTTLALSDPNGLLVGAPNTQVRYDEVIELPAKTLAPGAGGVRLTLTLPAGYKANDLAPLQVKWSSSGAVAQFAEPTAAEVTSPDYPLVLEFPANFAVGEGVVTGDVLVYYCREVMAELCLIRQVQVRQPLVVAAGAAGSTDVDVAWQPPALPDGY